MQRLAIPLALCVLCAGCGGSDASKAKTKTLLIAVNAPFSRTPYLGQTIANGAELEHLADLLADLRTKGLALLVIEHNLRFVRRVADTVTVLAAGRRIASGTLDAVAEDKLVRAAYLGRSRI